jgi:arylsulfatase A-like enzyme
LKPGASTLAAAELLESNAKAAGIGELYYGPGGETMFGKPGLPYSGGDPRVPDIIVTPNVGVVYTGSTKKLSEHGGFAPDDTNVLLVVSKPGMEARTVVSAVETSQVAPTILKLLGHSPDSLEAVRHEGTAVLPGLHFRD